MTFRTLGADDCALIAKIFSQSFSDGWTESMLKSGFNGGLLRAIGAFDGSEPIGVITFSVGLDSADVEDVAVIPKMRRKGVAKSLLENAEEQIFRSVDKIYLEVRESNLAAIALYQAAGFKGISVRKKYYSDGENAVVMAKERKNG